MLKMMLKKGDATKRGEPRRAAAAGPGGPLKEDSNPRDWGPGTRDQGLGDSHKISHSTSCLRRHGGGYTHTINRKSRPHHYA